MFKKSNQEKLGRVLRRRENSKKKSAQLKENDENLQKKYSTQKKSFDRIGKLIIRENYVGEFYKKKELLNWKQQETKTGRSFNQLVVPKELRRQMMSVNQESAFSGHVGATKTEVRILPNFFWPGRHQVLLFL